MDIKKTFNPCDLTHITNKKLQARNQRTDPQQAPDSAHALQPVYQKNSGFLAKNQKEDIEDLFMSLLMGGDNPLKQTSRNATAADKNTFRSHGAAAQGTAVSAKPQTQEGTSAAAANAGSFSFNVENKLVGGMVVTGQTRDGTCSLQIKLERELEQKEKHVLEKILEGNLARVLDIRVEVKID